MNKWTKREFGCRLLLILLVIAMLTVASMGSYLVFLLLIPIMCSMIGISYYTEKELDG